MNHASRRTGVALVVALLGSFARGQITERVSLDSAAAQADSGSWTPGVSISADGRFVSFRSYASNLVAGDTNGFADIFVRDRQSGTTERVSVATGGAQADFYSLQSSISADGRYVAFLSYATNLVPGDTNGHSDVFVRDRQNGTTERVSLGLGGVQANMDSLYPGISADGRYVTFWSGASNLFLNDTNLTGDIFVRDLQAGVIECVSVDPIGTDALGYCDFPKISADGRFVAFRSNATTLVAGDTNGVADIFVRDRQSATTERVSVSTSGAEGDGYAWVCSISGDGRFVAFVSQASNLVAGDTTGLEDAFVRDRQSGTTERVSLTTGGVQQDSYTIDCTISADGRYVSFRSTSTNLVPGDTNQLVDVFVHDRQTGTTERVNVGPGGAQANSNSDDPALSADGRFVAFGSGASNLVVGDTNGVDDVFVRDRFASPPPIPYCFGDGTGAPCPCGNGAPGNGCPSSVNASGANLVVGGSSSLANDTLVLAGSGMPDSTCLYFQGTTQVAVAFGDGLRCVGGSIRRLGRKTNTGGASQYPVGSDPSVSAMGKVTAPGMRAYQGWYRNAAVFCTPAVFNLSNGCAVTWVP